MHTFRSAGIYWWRKPLVLGKSGPIPAELAVLVADLRPGEKGMWLNSNGTKTGVVDLATSPAGTAQDVFETRRELMPISVSKLLQRLYRKAGPKGRPDVIVWRGAGRNVRFVEVKRADRDRISPDQKRFHQLAAAEGVTTKVVEWQFSNMASTSVSKQR
jgi:hypothetical protein